MAVFFEQKEPKSIDHFCTYKSRATKGAADIKQTNWRRRFYHLFLLKSQEFGLIWL